MKAFKKPFVRSAYNYDMAAASAAIEYEVGESNPTVQSAKDEADINKMVRRFGVTGLMNQVPIPPLAEEFAEIFDFQSALNVMRRAEESFAALPAVTRARFGNDAGAFAAFCTERDNEGALVNVVEMRKMGLAVEPPKVVEEVPMKVEVVNPPSADASAGGAKGGK